MHYLHMPVRSYLIVVGDLPLTRQDRGKAQKGLSLALVSMIRALSGPLLAATVQQDPAEQHDANKQTHNISRMS